MKIEPTPGHVVIRLVRPKSVERKGKLVIPGHGDLSVSQAGFKPYGKVMAVCWHEESDPHVPRRFEEGDIVAFQRGITNPVALRDPEKPANTPPDIIIEIEAVVAKVSEMAFDFEEGI